LLWLKAGRAPFERGTLRKMEEHDLTVSPASACTSPYDHFR